ncbi:MAG: methyltransferase domain-containing protein [Planctomycetes bacterium]|nr:methyltransferase domain-containing protein [Planctomycetota bacterium]
MPWDPTIYGRFSSERARPFGDLLAQINVESPGTIVDLGCGAGALTQTLSERWPAAHVIGVDNSAEMLAAAQPLSQRGRLEFVEADLATWKCATPIDLIVSNAALHWIDDHAALLARLTAVLAAGGTLAVQMPNNFRAPSHTILFDLVHEARWRERVAGVGLHADSVQPLAWYVERLHALGCVVNAWETTYMHVLRGPQPVLNWLRGTSLRPLLARLDEQEAAEFERELGRRLDQAYPPSGDVTLFPFSRIFFSARNT